MEYIRSVCCKQVIGSRMNAEYIPSGLWQEKWINFVVRMSENQIYERKMS